MSTTICGGYTEDAHGNQWHICVNAPDNSYVSSWNGRCAQGFAYTVISGGNGSVPVCVPLPTPVTQQAPANVTVSPVINTTVSPQISPVLQQQFQPTNSPATASTSQTASTPSQPVQQTPSPAPQATVPVSQPQPQQPVYTLPQQAPQAAIPQYIPPMPIPALTNNASGSSAAPDASPVSAPNPMDVYDQITGTNKTPSTPVLPLTKPDNSSMLAIAGLGLLFVLAIGTRKNVYAR